MKFLKLTTILLFSTVYLFSQVNNDVVNFSHKAGYYRLSFTLTLSSPFDTDSIAYTLDGGNPANKNNYFKVGKNIDIAINPDSTKGRGKTPAFIVKASILRNGKIAVHPLSQTYIFLEKVKKQKYPGGSWPAQALVVNERVVGGINGQALDYEIDTNVLRNPAYAPLVDRALLSFPVLSISTDMNFLFNKTTGIYVNAGSRGDSWERECSAELINPDGSPGFTINAGLRIRGGASRNGKNGKHSFRLFFKDIYGAGKLHYPLFGDEGASEFDKVDIRTEQNYSWNADFEQNTHNTFVRDIFSRDAQGKMGRPYSRGRYYHLFLNGMYWGIFQTDERTDAKYAETYFGGKDTDYDVIKVSPASYPYKIEIADGNDQVWRELYQMCQFGFTTADYFKLEGKDENGNRIPGAKVYIDIDNFIDYLIVIFYTGNFDAPVSAFGGNDMPNNFFAIYNRQNKSQGFKFIAHDSEHSMMTEAIYAGKGLNEDRINLTALYKKDGWLNYNVATYADFHPQWIHEKLTAVAEYRQRFIDRSAIHFNDKGIFTPNVAKNLCLKRVIEVDTAIVVESARWGNARTVTRTRNDTWRPEILKLFNTFFPQRSNIVINQLISAGLYALIQPLFTIQNDTVFTSDYSFSQSMKLKLSPSSSSGSVYYTTNGLDPRSVGGQIATEAINIITAQEINISTSTIIKARIKYNDIWGPIRTLNCLSDNDDYINLKITEINYHPKDELLGTDTVSGKDLEFIEFKNIGKSSLNLSGLKIDSAINYTFPENTILAPGQFFVVASKPYKFGSKYSYIASGNFQGNLANSSDSIIVVDRNGKSIINMRYLDYYPWPIQADGGGYSLVATERNPLGNPSLATYWKVSRSPGGNPFTDDSIVKPTNLNSSYASNSKVYPNPCKDVLKISVNNKSERYNTLELYDQMGSLIYRKFENNDEFSLSFKLINVKPGVYLLRINNNRVERVVYIP